VGKTATAVTPWSGTNAFPIDVVPVHTMFVSVMVKVFPAPGAIARTALSPAPPLSTCNAVVTKLLTITSWFNCSVVAVKVFWTLRVATEAVFVTVRKLQSAVGKFIGFNTGVLKKKRTKSGAFDPILLERLRMNLN